MDFHTGGISPLRVKRGLRCQETPKSRGGMAVLHVGTELEDRSEPEIRRGGRGSERCPLPTRSGCLHGGQALNAAHGKDTSSMWTRRDNG